MPKPQREDDLFPYTSTGGMAHAFTWYFEGSIVPFLRKRMGFRYNSPRKWFGGLVAGLLCVMVQEGSGKYEHGVSVLFLLIYLLVGSVQQAGQNRRLRLGVEIHSHSSGMPVLAGVFKHASYQTLLVLEIGLLVTMSAASEALRLPLSLWLLLSAVALIVRGSIDAYAQRLADADAQDAYLEAAEMQRKLRRRHGE